MSFWETIAGIALLMNDFIAVASVIGSGLMLFAPRRGRKRKIDDKIQEWSVIGLICGVTGQVAIAVTGRLDQPVGIFFRMDSGLVNTLLALSFLLIAVRTARARYRPQRSG